jgi:cation:H+ antiporter
MPDALYLLLGLLCAGIGGELFIRGTVGLAKWARIPSGIIGATIAAFATSSPELSVSINAATAGNPQIALGDALGSNVVNVGLTLGLALLFGGIQATRDSIRRDFPVALIAPMVLGIMAVDGKLSRLDALLMLGLFFAWLIAATLEAKRQRSAAEDTLGEQSHPSALAQAVIGLGLLVLAGRLIVVGAKGIGARLGMDPFIVGATMVAVGTSIPELATTIISRLRGHEEIGLGTIVGSNIFNGLFIIGVASAIHPIALSWREVASGLLFGILLLALVFPNRHGFIERRRGALLLALYVIYVFIMIQFRPESAS